MIFTTASRIFLVFLLGLVLTGLAGCERKPASSAALVDEGGILQYVPGDTPYVIVNTGPIADDLIHKMTGDSRLAADAYRMAVREALLGSTEELPPDSEEYRQAEQLADIVSSLLEMTSLDGMRKAGFDINESMAFYGHGLLPVWRAKLTDAARFEAAMAGIEAEAGQSLDTAELDEYTYRFVDNEAGRIILGAFDDYVVLTFAPTAFGDPEIRKLVGLELPPDNLAQNRKLAEIAGEYGYTPHYLGFVDIARLASTITEQPGELDALLLRSAESDLSQTLSDVCRQEILEVAAISPRTVFGYTKIADDGINGAATVELRPDLAAGLMTLPAIVPGLGVDHGGLFSIGFSVNPGALREFYEARLDAISADPFGCEYFVDINASVERGRAALAQPIPPVVYGFRGLVAVFDDLDLGALQANMPPANSDAAVLLAVEDAPTLLMSAAMFSPELAALDIKPDGEPVAVEMQQTAWLPEPPVVAMTDSSLVLATGADSTDRVARLLHSGAADPAPFLSFAGDAGRYYELVGSSLATGEANSQLSPEAAAAMKQSMDALARVYDRLSVDVHFTARGVEIDAALTFK